MLASGLVERIGEDGARLVHRPADGEPRVVERRVTDHVEGFRLVFAELGHPAVEHRIVHGGDRFFGPVLVDDAVLAELEALTPLAPLHNPAGTRGVAPSPHEVAGILPTPEDGMRRYASAALPSPPTARTCSCSATAEAARWRARCCPSHATCPVTIVRPTTPDEAIRAEPTLALQGV